MTSYIKHILNEIRKSVGVKLKFLIELTGALLKDH